MVDARDYAFWDAAFWDAHGPELTTFGIYAVGIAVYGLVVFMFYRFMAARDMRLTKPEPAARRSAGGSFLAVLRYLFLFPIVSVGYAAMMVTSLFFLSKDMTVDQILLTSMSLVAGIRVSAYVSEAAAEELARLVPLGLLGVLVVDPGYISFATTWARFESLPSFAGTIALYFGAFVALELVLRLVYLMVPRRARSRAEDLIPKKRTIAPAEAPAKARR